MKTLNGRNDSRIKGEYPTYAEYTDSGNTVYECTDSKLYTGQFASHGYDRVINLTPLTAAEIARLRAKGIKIGL